MTKLTQAERTMLSYLRKKPRALRSLHAEAWCGTPQINLDDATAALNGLVDKGLAVLQRKTSRYADCGLLYGLSQNPVHDTSA